MRSIKVKAALLLLTIVLNHRASAQCSDAGVCSIGGMEPTEHTLVVNAGFSYGASSKDEFAFRDLHLGVQANLTSDVTVQASLPLRSMKGPLGTVSGIGDLLVVARVPFWQDEETQAFVEGGVRLPSGGVNEGGLPQAYQPGLGTTDGLFGLSLVSGRFSASIGYQFSPGRSDNSVNRLRRGDDLSLRTGWTLLDDGFKVRSEVIIIQKLQLSNGLVPPGIPPPVSADIPDTDRTQVNLLGELEYPLTESAALNFRTAFALLSRPVNIDGLTRGFSVQAGISIPVR